MRQDGAVEHVWIREEDARALAQLGTLRLRRVAVVRRDGQPEEGRGACIRERAQRALLVLRKCLRWEQKECTAIAIRGHRMERRDEVAEGLARGGRRAQHHVPTPHECLHRARLVRVQPRAAGRLKECPHRRRKFHTRHSILCRARRLLVVVNDLIGEER